MKLESIPAKAGIFFRSGFNTDNKLPIWCRWAPSAPTQKNTLHPLEFGVKTFGSAFYIL